MTCSEVLELLPAVVDGQLGEEHLSRLNLHLNECLPCSHEFELERMTKNVVRKHSRSVGAPSHLLDRVRKHIHKEREQFAGTSPSANTVWKPSTATLFAFGTFSLIVLLVMFIIPSSSRHHSHTQPLDGNIIHQTYNNFDGVLNGTIRPQIETNDPHKVQAFFHPMVDFSVQVPAMKEFVLVGAVCSQYHGQCIAQLIYQNKQDIVYLYEVKLSTILRNESDFKITPEALAQLKHSGWYFENHATDCSLVMWMVDSTVCCAIADINKDVLFTSLTDSR